MSNDLGNAADWDFTDTEGWQAPGDQVGQRKTPPASGKKKAPAKRKKADKPKAVAMKGLLESPITI